MSGSGDFHFGSEVWPGTAKLIEECGELVEVLAKLIGGKGDIDYFGRFDIRERLNEELADVLAAATFFIEHNDVDQTFISGRMDAKLALFEQWHIDQRVAPPSDGDVHVTDRDGTSHE